MTKLEVRKKQSVAGFTEGRKTCCVCRKVQCFLLVNIMQPPKQPHGACVVILPSWLREYQVNSSREMRQWWSGMKSSIWQLRTLILELHHCMNLKKLNKVYYSRDCLERCLLRPRVVNQSNYPALNGSDLRASLYVISHAMCASSSSIFYWTICWQFPSPYCRRKAPPLIEIFDLFFIAQCLQKAGRPWQGANAFILVVDIHKLSICIRP